MCLCVFGRGHSHLKKKQIRQFKNLWDVITTCLISNFRSFKGISDITIFSARFFPISTRKFVSPSLKQIHLDNNVQKNWISLSSYLYLILFDVWFLIYVCMFVCQCLCVDFFRQTFKPCVRVYVYVSYNMCTCHWRMLCSACWLINTYWC